MKAACSRGDLLESVIFYALLSAKLIIKIVTGRAVLTNKFSACYAAAVLLAVATAGPVQGAETAVQRGKYLVSIIPCTDCHTPGTFLGKPEMKRYLGGSEVGFEVPGLGVFYGPNITPDDETGLGKWTKEQIAAAITEGKRPDGRILAPPMPVEFVQKPYARGCAGDRRLSQEPAADQEQGPGPIRPERKADLVRLSGAAAGSLHADADAAEVSVAQGRRSQNLAHVRARPRDSAG